MSSFARIIACILVGVVLELIWSAVANELSATPMVVGITLTALFTQKYREENNE